MGGMSIVRKDLIYSFFGERNTKKKTIVSRLLAQHVKVCKNRKKMKKDGGVWFNFKEVRRTLRGTYNENDISDSQVDKLFRRYVKAGIYPYKKKENGDIIWEGKPDHAP